MKGSFWKTLIKGFLIPIIGIWLASSVFNLFDYISFVPQEHKYEAGITTYFVLLEFAFNSLGSLLFGQVSCVFYTSEKSKDITSNPTITFPDVDVVFISLKVSANGSKYIIQKLRLQIALPSYIEPQLTEKCASLSLGRNNDCLVDFSKLFPVNYDRNNDFSVDYKIGLIRDSIDEKCSINITPKIICKPCFSRMFISYSHNFVNLRN